MSGYDRPSSYPLDGITAGCGGGNYCPDGTMSRYTLSVYIATAMAGSGNVPASGSGYNCVAGGTSLAADVDPASSYCKFANFLMASGVMPKSPDVVDSSNGCATGNFCGTATVTRADMAVYMARAIAGSDAQVPAKYSNAEAGRSYDIATPSTLVFSDVSATAQMGSVQYAKHVYYLWALNVVSGTSSTTYSPANSVTRGQMATFLAAGFHLPRRPATGTAYADGITYATNGTIASVVHGDGTTDVVERDPDSIARPAAIKTYGAPTTYSSGNYAYDGAGNIKTIGPDHFYYDLASRLTEGTTSAGTKAQQLAYDAYGNITSRTNNGTNTGYTIQASTNRATAVGGTSWGYDGAGDVTSIGTTTYAYDPLGMMTTLTAPTFTSYYFYTPDDERIWTKTGSGSSWASTWTVRGTDAKVLREMTSTATSNTGTDANYSWKKDYVYRDGLLLAAITGTDTEHFHLDHLGTPRLITYLNGTASAERHDYYPFGEEVTLAGNEEMKFTGHERDSNSGLDYMHARFANDVVARFMSPDPLIGPILLPQTLNRYSYVSNNPLKLVDPTGLCEQKPDEPPCSDMEITVTAEAPPPDMTGFNDFLYNSYLFSSGGANAYASDNLLGAGRVNSPDLYYELGQVFGDVGAISTGLDEMLAGGTGDMFGLLSDLAPGGQALGMLVNTVSSGVAAHGATTTGVATWQMASGVKRLERQITLHQQKIAEYRANPDAHDNKGFLKNAPPERRAKIIESRIRSLEGQIETFKREIERILGN